MARVENQRSAVQWDPFFGPPVRLGDGGMGWKTDKDPRSKMPNGDLGQLPDTHQSLMPNQQLRHYGVAPIQQQQYMTQQYAPPGQPYQQQAYYGAQGGGAPYYQGPPPQMLQANPSFHQQPSNQPYGSPLRPGGAPAYVPAPQYYYVASGQPPQAAYYAAPQQQAYADPANTLGLSVAPREDPLFEFGVTPRQESGKAKLSEEELNSVLRTEESDDPF